MPQSDRPVPAPAAYLDHVVVMLDGEALHAVLECELIRGEYGRFKVKTATSSLAATYTSAGIAGVETLMELFDVAAPPLPSLVGALVLSFAVPGSLAAVRPRLEEQVSAAVSYELVRRTVAEGEEPRAWYHLVRPDFGPDSPFIVMLAEVTPEYFAHLGAQRGPHGELQRKAYLTAALGAEHRPDHYLADITEVTINLDATRARILGETLTALGYREDVASEGRCFVGPGIAIRAITSDCWREGIIEIRNSLQRRKSDPLTYRFGTTTSLTFVDDGTALWRFSPPAPAASKA